MMAIFDPTSLTSLPAGQVGIYQSTTLASSLQSNGVTWLQYQLGDQIPAKGGSASLSSTTWGQAASQCGLPALVQSNNGVVSAIPLPQTQAQIVQMAFDIKRKP
jgi:hypothetical protein